jgi:hypothetical protein
VARAVIRGLPVVGALVLTFGLGSACGARTSLDANELDAGVRDGGGAGDAPTLLDAPKSLCRAALLRGAPAPIDGYCPTKAGQSSFEAPDSKPHLAWSVALPGLPNTNVPVIVAPNRRVYVILDQDKVDPSAPYERVVAVDDGTIRWNLDLATPIWNPILAADGSLLVWSSDESIHRVDPSGALLGTLPFPRDGLGGPGVASDGTLFFSIDVFSDAGARVLAFTQTAETRWVSPVVGPYGQMATGIDDSTIMTYLKLLAPLSIDAGRAPVFEGWVASVRPADGSVAWRTKIGDPGYIQDGPAVGLDGSLYFVVWTSNDTKNELVVLNPDGSIRVRADLGEPPCCAGTTFLTLGLDGAAFVKAGQSFIGVDKDGVRRFKHPSPPNINAGCTVDAKGRVLLSTDTDIELLDPLSGDTIWRASTFSEDIHADGHVLSYPSPATLGDRVLYFVDGFGTLFALR